MPPPPRADSGITRCRAGAGGNENLGQTTRSIGRRGLGRAGALRGTWKMRNGFSITKYNEFPLPCHKLSNFIRGGGARPCAWGHRKAAVAQGASCSVWEQEVPTALACGISVSWVPHSVATSGHELQIP